MRRSSSQRGRALTWVLVGLVLLLALAGGGVSLRSSHVQSILEETVVRHRAEGLGFGVEDLLQHAPPIDEDLQAKCLAWLEEGVRLATYPHGTWCFPTGAERSEAWRTVHEAYRAYAERLAGMLATNRLCLSGFGWLARSEGTDVPYAPSTPLGRARRRLFVAVTEAARWFAAESARAEDPAPALGNLDRLIAALRPVALGFDAYLLRGPAQARDEAYVCAARAGRLTPALRKSWIEDVPDHIAHLADECRGSRLGTLSFVAQAILDGDPERSHPGRTGRRGFWKRLRDEAYERLQRPKDIARLLEISARTELHLRGRLPAHALWETDPWVEQGGGALSLGAADYRLWIASAVACGTAHRAARVVVLALAEQNLPETQDALRGVLGDHASLLDAGPWQLALRYERPAPDRVRVCVDPDTPLPEVLRGWENDLLDEDTCGEAGVHLPFRLSTGGIDVQLPGGR